jgi:ArsR family transcriptional regulator, arsenate/arsenite/antimonite-responsive transcriptional repressor
MKAIRDTATADSIIEFVPFFKAFCNETRAQIIEFLLGGERCVCEMTGPLDLSQPLVSHHLAFLRDAGLVRMRGEGARTYYSIDSERFDAELQGFLAYVERLRSAPANPERTEIACVNAAQRPAQRNAS